MWAAPGARSGGLGARRISSSGVFFFYVYVYVHVRICSYVRTYELYSEFFYFLIGNI